MAQIYNVEDDFDFYKALNETDDVSDKNNICMITHLPLSFNSVTLPCQHSFNYMPLYTDLCIQRNYRRIRCPYCRAEFDKFIPFIPLPNVLRVIGVNSPEQKCMPAPKCHYTMKTGIHKGKVCSMNGMEIETGIFCKKHLLEHTVKAQAQAQAQAQAEAEVEIWTTEMNDLSNSKTVVELRKMLRMKGMLVGGTKKELVKRLFL